MINSEKQKMEFVRFGKISNLKHLKNLVKKLIIG